MCHKKKLKFENHKNCLESTQPDNKTKYLEKNTTDIESIKKNLKELIKSNKLILKTQKRFKSERHNAFTKEINKTAFR